MPGAAIALDILRGALLGSGGDDSKYDARGSAMGDAGHGGGGSEHGAVTGNSVGGDGQELDPLEAIGLMGSSEAQQVSKTSSAKGPNS